MKNLLYGAILGDLAGQPYEFKPKFQGDFDIHNPISHFTDDTIMTLATASAILNSTDFDSTYRSFGKRYSGDYYGSQFKQWIKEPKGTEYDSWGNGCLMRLSPLIYAKANSYQILRSCICSHNHPISISSVFALVNEYKNPEERKRKSISQFQKFEVRADKTLDFCLNVNTYPWRTIWKIEAAISCGGDTDTNASIVGELSNYKLQDLNKKDVDYVESKLDPFLLSILLEFNKKYAK